MSLTRRLAAKVSRAVQQRGRVYFQRGTVTIVDGGGDVVRARVRGTELYHVQLKRNLRIIQAWCDCPYCTGNESTCKHIWATLLAAEARGYLRAGDAGGLVLHVIENDAKPEPAPVNGHPAMREHGENGYHHGRREFRQRRPLDERRPDWTRSLALIQGAMQKGLPIPREAWPPGRELLYAVDVPGTQAGRGLLIEVGFRQRKKDGQWTKPKFQRIPHSASQTLPDLSDREILSLLAGAQQEDGLAPNSYFSHYYDSAPTRYRLSAPLQDVLVPLLCRTGRCRLRRTAEDAELAVLRWDEGHAWEFWLEIAPDPRGKNYVVAGTLRRDDERLSLAEPTMLVPGGLVFWDHRVARLVDFGAFEWTALLRRDGPLTVPVTQREKLLGELLRLPRLPRLELPEELRFEERPASTMRPKLVIKAPDRPGMGHPTLLAELFFNYDGAIVAAGEAGRGVYQPDQRLLLLREPSAEQAAMERLTAVGVKPSVNMRDPMLEVAAKHLDRVVRTLAAENWDVEAEGKVYRQPGEFRIAVKSGLDWFDLQGRIDYGDDSVALPDLLAAVRRGEQTIRLGDGSVGLIPEDWLKKYGLLAGLGTVDGDNLRFRRSQVGLLDALLATQPNVTADAVFAQARDMLRRFEGIESAAPPVEFKGELRGYQSEGLGWLQFLQRFGFGGCLADDMGLGKTVQVLALLESRRELRAAGGKNAPGPSLVVVPRSLVFNWQQEAARFAPNLRVLDHTGVGREKAGAHFEQYDLILTTYGTLRRDASYFREHEFDYCILDEAQAVKNAGSESAKAVRLLHGRHRLALSGTPVENHLGELWSLFEFLNPGMLGSASVFKIGATGRQVSEEMRSLLARALRPFILRRTKAQVAKDLPEKLEQTITCEMEPAQRKLYDDLRDHYRNALLGRIATQGINKSKIQILEALLRLRQAACHPALIDPTRIKEGSAKLDVLLPQLSELLEEGHKVLVFSQFTKFLGIVKDHLDQDGIVYEYLDGRTRDRAAKVEKFQTDPDCKLFLISLKAGGLGLNLTAADYVFLLDPWWNPAVEAQAIDRAYRIGQTRQVFAYRLIARDTVEEKVVQLQQTKRALADAIINADNSLIRDLGKEDLELLLS